MEATLGSVDSIGTFTSAPLGVEAGNAVQATIASTMAETSASTAALLGKGLLFLGGAIVTVLGIRYLLHKAGFVKNF